MSEGTGSKDSKIEDFLRDAQAVLGTLDHDLITLEEHLDKPSEALLTRLFDNLRTLEELSGFLKLKRLTKLSHSIKNIIGVVRDEGRVLKSVVMDHLFKGQDQMCKMVEHFEKHDLYDISQLVIFYDQVLENPNFPEIHAEEAGEAEQSAPWEGLIAELEECQDMARQFELLEALSGHHELGAIIKLFPFYADPPDSVLFSFIRDALEKMIKDNQEAILTALSSESRSVQDFGLYLMRKHKVTEGLPHIRRILNSTDDEDIIRECLLVLTELRLEETEDILTKYIHHEEPFIASRAVTGLLRLSRQSAFQTISKEFSKLPEIPSLEVLHCMEDHPNPGVLDFLVQHANHPYPSVRKALAKRVLGGDKEKLIPILKKYLLEGETEEQKMTLELAKRVNSPDLVPLLLEKTKAQDTNVRFAALEALSESSPEQAVTVCLDQLLDPDPYIRNLTWSLLDQNMDDSIAQKVLESFSDSGAKSLILETVSQVVLPNLLIGLGSGPEVQKEMLAAIINSKNHYIAQKYQKTFRCFLFHDIPLCSGFDDPLSELGFFMHGESQDRKGGIYASNLSN